MDYRTYVVEAGRKMLERKLTVETWGNISARDPETGFVYLTPSAMPYQLLQEEDIVVLRPDGSLAGGTRKPTIETAMHLDIYQSRPEIRAIIHTHPIYSQVFATLRREIPPIIDEAAQILGGTVYPAEYALPGTPELAANAVKTLGSDRMACLLANHGAVCLGETMDQAFTVCTVLEMTAQIYQMALAIGEPRTIRPEDVVFMKEFVRNHYGQDKD